MKIFVGNVDGADTTPEELAALFAPYGTVMSCAVMKQFAFVHMRENAGALRAIEALHGHELRPGRALVVEMSRPRPLNTWKIFVGNVSAACTSQELRSLFERRGRVIECDVVKGNAGARAGHSACSHAPYPGVGHCPVGRGRAVRGSEAGGVGGAVGWSPPPPLRSGHHSPSGRQRLWVGAAAATCECTGGAPSPGLLGWHRAEIGK